MSDSLTIVFLAILIAMLVLVMVIICINLYEIFEEPAIQKRMRQLRKPVQPWVTVLLYTRDNQATIKGSLKALVKNNYQNYDIVVVNDRSKDDTLEKVKEFTSTHPKSLIVLVNRRKRNTAKAALEAGYRKSKHGKIIISLRADTIVKADFIKRAVATKDAHEYVTLRLQNTSSASTLGEIIYSLSNIVWLHSKKATVSDSKHILPVQLEVRPDFIAVLLFIGLISVSIITNETIIIWYGWIIVTSYLLAGIWLHPEGLITKIKLSFSAVSALFLLPVSSFIQAVSQFHSRI